MKNRVVVWLKTLFSLPKDATKQKLAIANFAALFLVQRPIL